MQLLPGTSITEILQLPAQLIEEFIAIGQAQAKVAEYRSRHS